MEDTSDKGITEFETRWIGWAGVNVPDEIGQKSLTEALAEKVDHIFIKNKRCLRGVWICILKVIMRY